MGFFWASKPNEVPQTTPHHYTQGDIPAVCPMHKKTPVSDHDEGEINPMTNMPYNLPVSKAPGQTLDLPTERTISTIPRGENQGLWEYPSPQQMFNAMIRKGKGDVPEDAVESMVNIHNFLNEGAWEEIMEWEKPYTDSSKVNPRLLKFTGRPDTISPRAQYYLFMSKLFPEKYSTEPPFDRHDWTVLRNNGNGDWNEVRYIIDYYSSGEDHFGMPMFSLDVRPALDNVDNAVQRFNHWTHELKPTWDKALGKEQK